MPPPREQPIPKAPTGIEGFDEITNGGLPAGRTTLVIGGPGAGKTIFALESLVNAAHTMREPGIFVAFEETSRQIVANAATFGWDLPALEKEQLFFLDAQLSPAHVQAGDFDITGILAGLADQAQRMKAKRIVFDGIDVLLAVLDDPGKERREVHRLHEWLRTHQLTAVLTAKSADDDRIFTEHYGFMQFMVDAVVSLQHRLSDRVSLRSIRVLKYRGSGFAENEFPIIISPNGIEVSTFGPRSLDHPTSNERVSTGIERLDTMLNGGYYRGSSVLITGAPGTSKTTLAGAFSAGACARGERVLYVSFDESGGQIVRNLRSVSIDLGRWEDEGLLEFYAMRTEARSAEEHLIGLKRVMTRFRPTAMVLDPISALEKSGGHLAAVHASLRLIDVARSEGITMVCTSLVSGIELDTEATPTQISTIADTWIHLAYLISNGERNRTLTVVKQRGTRHSNQVRELVLSDAGISLADVYTAGGTVLVGTARWEHEAAQADAASRAEADRVRRRQTAAHAEAKLRAQIAALESEVAMHRVERELLDEQDSRRDRRAGDRKAVIRQLRRGDTDRATEPPVTSPVAGHEH
jgi:circadian clock protein KaiC